MKTNTWRSPSTRVRNRVTNLIASRFERRRRRRSVGCRAWLDRLSLGCGRGRLRPAARDGDKGRRDDHCNCVLFMMHVAQGRGVRQREFGNAEAEGRGRCAATTMVSRARTVHGIDSNFPLS